jgi:hypothetical protein
LRLLAARVSLQAEARVLKPWVVQVLKAVFEGRLAVPVAPTLSRGPAWAC